MCEFFSLISDGKGKIYYFDAKVRKEIIASKSEYSNTDSHTSIADYFGFKGAKEDKMNKYEYNPLTKEFTIDQINTTDDSAKVEKKCRKLDFKLIVPELVTKPIIHPFVGIPERKRVTKKEILLLKKWDSVRDSMWASVRASVRDSMWDSVGASVWAYISSFFDIPKWKGIKHKKGSNPFQSCITLWEKGLVPSFDGEIWRLHSGPNAKIIYEISAKELRYK